MIATVRLDDNVISKLSFLSNKLNKKKSEVIREAIIFYANEIENRKKSRILDAVERVKSADLKENIALEGSLKDGI